jgi:hypothetical protein
MNVAAFRDPSADKAYSILKTPSWSGWTLGPISGLGGKRARQTGDEILLAHDLP